MVHLLHRLVPLRRLRLACLRLLHRPRLLSKCVGLEHHLVGRALESPYLLVFHFHQFQLLQQPPPRRWLRPQRIRWSHQLRALKCCFHCLGPWSVTTEKLFNGLKETSWLNPSISIDDHLLDIDLIQLSIFVCELIYGTNHSVSLTFSVGDAPKNVQASWRK